MSALSMQERGTAMILAGLITLWVVLTTAAGIASPNPNRLSAEASEPPCWRGDFEPGNGWDRVQAEPGRIEVVDSPVRQGSYAGRYTLHPGDYVSKGERAEVLRDHKHREGDETWLAWSLFLPSVEFRSEPGRNVVFTQWHDNLPSFGWPPIVVTIKPRDGVHRFGLEVRGGDEHDSVFREWTFTEIPFDEWVDLKMHVVWSATDDGLIEFWIDGAKALSANTPTIFADKWVYLKQGNYRSPSTLVSSLYQDATVVASTEEDLDCPG